MKNKLSILIGAISLAAAAGASAQTAVTDPVGYITAVPSTHPTLPTNLSG